MKRVYRDKRRRYTGQHPGTKSASRPVDKTGGQPQVLFLRRFFPDMPCVKGFTETNRRPYTGQQSGTKCVFRPGDKPLIKSG